MNYKLKVEDFKDVSIVDYLSDRGFRMQKKGRLTYCFSPLSQEKTPSFCIYPTNTFYDWANGVGGDIIKLVAEMEGLNTYQAMEYLSSGDFEEIDTQFIQEEKEREEFNLTKFLNRNSNEIADIKRYAMGRSIVSKYLCGVFYLYDDNGYIRRPALAFVHTDIDGNVCGVKLRDIRPYKGRRFSARGTQMYYILHTEYSETNPLYIVESESSANSLYQFFKILKKKATIVSFGSWSNIPKDLPSDLSKMSKKHVIIDYDGNGDLYDKKIEKFSHFNAREVKLELPKGEDLNSLFHHGKLYKHKNQLI